ncbi:hypothetical protein BO86DRAFT_393657 [Aspergillus japonicus CBS 114.51]|nr:hypothetical protein BO86DRAFT_393657 [Aspergillus japonicus CBS 114.51]RAH76144.1 hypothetical protein BO86DRAFT_393657 [Aspergillus japonicus CBS 114.51]
MAPWACSLLQVVGWCGHAWTFAPGGWDGDGMGMVALAAYLACLNCSAGKRTRIVRQR